MRKVALIIGWIFSVLGGLLAILFALLFLFCIGLGPYGMIVAFSIAAPLCLLGIVLFFMGRFIKNRAHKMQLAGDSEFHAPAYPPSYLLPQQKEPS